MGCSYWLDIEILRLIPIGGFTPFVEVVGMIVTEIFQIAGLVVCYSHIAEDQQIRGENFLQAREFGHRQVFGDLGQEEESLEQLVEPLEVGFAFFVGEFYSENGLVLVQGNQR